MINSNKITLVEKLQALKIPGYIEKMDSNEFYNNYYVRFNPDITINKIKARAADISLFFDGSAVDIEPAAGGLVLIKTSKGTRTNSNYNDFIPELVKRADNGGIPLVIGTTEDGEKLFFDLVKCPHLLVAGATGSGKSVFMHNLILSTFYSSDVHLMLIDVKRVEFSIYENIPHLVTPVIYEARTAAKKLNDLCYEMDRRYKTLKDSGSRNIDDYRNAGGNMGYIAVFIDELADLILSDKNIETYITRLAQLGRAAGIHLITATQRPDSSILSGLIRSNIPSRVCFAVQKATDSRIILDMSGGENLNGRGDGLFLPVGSRKPARFQAPYIDDTELQKMVSKARHVND